MLFKHIAIVGLGLIGGSFALAVRRANLAERITAWDTSDALDKALASGVIDAPEEAFEAGRVCAAELIYLAAPVGAIIHFLLRRRAQVKSGAIVTDAGSTKREICRAAREGLADGVHFIGGHPMAGSQHRGFEYASGDLFRGAPYALVADDESDPSDEAQAEALKRVQRLIEAIGGRPVIITAARHDRAVARISQAPQLIATALAIAVAESGDTDALTLAGSGFADMTRLAASHWSVWEDILRTNGDEISRALVDFSRSLEVARMAMAANNAASMQEAFRAANEFIRRVNEKKALNV
jgi:prephenate dehydrogenase